MTQRRHKSTTPGRRGVSDVGDCTLLLVAVQ